MDIWKILGIEATNDKKKIKSAYREKLHEVNPESQPEAFMELREAYEKALREESMKDEQPAGTAGDASSDYSGKTDSSDSTSSVSQWKKKLELLYGNNEQRFLTEAWKELLCDDVCYSLDTRDDAGMEFMAFFGEHTHISQEVLKAAEAVFHFTEKVEELTEYFPYELIDYFVNYRLREEEFPPYSFFARSPVPGADYDEYIEDVIKLSAAVNEGDRNKADRILDRLDETGICHPSVEIKRAWLYSENEQKFEEILQTTEQKWGEYDEALCARGQYLLQHEKPGEAEIYFRRILEISPSYESAVILLAISLKNQKKYVEARDILLDVGNAELRVQFSGLLEELEEEMIQSYEERQRNGDSLTEEEINCLSLAYFRKNRLEEAQKTIDLLKGKEAWETKRLRMEVLVRESRREWEEAFPLADTLVRQLESREQTKDNRIYLAEAYTLRGRIRMHQGRKTEGLEDVDKGIVLSPNPEDYMLEKATMLMHFDFYDLAADVLSQLIERNPGSIFYRYGRGVCNFRSGALQEAHEDFEYVSIMEEDNQDSYIYKMTIYLEAGAKEEIEETFRLFEEKGFDTDSVRLMKGIYQEYSEDYAGAEKTFEQIIRDYDPEKSDLDHIGEVYVHLAQVGIELDKRGFSVLKCLKEGLKKEPEYVPLLEKRCEINEALEIEDDLEKDVREILRLNPFHEIANAKMADICEDAGRIEEAMGYLNMQKEANDSVALRVNMAFNRIMAGDLETARDHIAIAEKKDSEFIGVKRIQAFYCCIAGEDEKAIELYRELSEEDEEQNYCEEIANCCCHLGDIDGARKQYQELLKKGEKEEVYRLLFELELDLGNYRDAEKMLKLWQSSRKKLFKDDSYRVKAGRLCIGKHQYKKAKELMDAAEVNEGAAREFAGVLNLYEGKTGKALKYFMSGIKEWPDYMEFYFYAGIAYLILGEPEKTVKLAKKALDLINQNERVCGRLKDRMKYLGTFYSLLGDFENAGKCFDEALKAPMCYDCNTCRCHEVYTKMAVMYHLMGEEEKCLEALETAGKIKPDDIDFIGLRKLIEKHVF